MLFWYFSPCTKSLVQSRIRGLIHKRPIRSVADWGYFESRGCDNEGWNEVVFFGLQWLGCHADQCDVLLPLSGFQLIVFPTLLGTITYPFPVGSLESMISSFPRVGISFPRSLLRYFMKRYMLGQVVTKARTPKGNNPLKTDRCFLLFWGGTGGGRGATSSSWIHGSHDFIMIWIIIPKVWWFWTWDPRDFQIRSFASRSFAIASEAIFSGEDRRGSRNQFGALWWWRFSAEKSAPKITISKMAKSSLPDGFWILRDAILMFGI